MKEKDTELYDRLHNGLQEIRQFLRGEIALRCWEFEDPPPELTPEQIVALRQKRKMSQAAFAEFLEVTPRTVQSWEQGLRKPSRAKLMTMQIMSAKPKMMRRKVGAANGRKKKPA